MAARDFELGDQLIEYPQNGIQIQLFGGTSAFGFSGVAEQPFVPQGGLRLEASLARLSNVSELYAVASGSAGLPLGVRALPASSLGSVDPGAAALPVLADELVQTMPDRAAAAQARDKFLRSTVEQMHAFADGQGDVPTVVKRSGKWTVDGIKHGRTEMSYFLGIAYLEGASVNQDSQQAVRWLQRAASLGNRPAQARLGAFR